MRQIFWILTVVVVVILSVVWYTNRTKTRAVKRGDALVREQARAGASVADVASSDQITQMQQPGTVATGKGSQSDGVKTPAAADSLERNPPNGMIFAGRGKYQLYRQGDITWRLNTDSGQACILFATDAEWHKPRVFQQGCGGS